MRKLIVGFVIFSFSLSALFQSSRAAQDNDAAFIVGRLVTEETFAAAFQTMEPLLNESLTIALSKGLARDLSPTSRTIVMEAFLDAFRTQFLDRMRNNYIDIYRSILSESELAGLRKFLETPAGVGFANAQVAIIKRGSSVGMHVGQNIGNDVRRILGRRLADEQDKFVVDEQDRKILQKLFPKL